VTLATAAVLYNVARRQAAPCRWARPDLFCLSAGHGFASARRRVRRPARAFSLIEVLIASALLGIGVTAMVSGYRSATSLEAHQEKVSVALHVGERVVEELLLRYREDVDIAVDGAVRPTPPLRFGADGTPVTTGGLYSVTWRATPGPVSGSRKLDVTVNWTEQAFTGAQSLVLTTHRN